MTDDFDPSAVPPTKDDPLGDPAAAEREARLAEARALLDALRPATEENKERFLEAGVLRASALLREHDAGYFVRLSNELRPLKILREWLKAVKAAGERMAARRRRTPPPPRSRRPTPRRSSRP